MCAVHFIYCFTRLPSEKPMIASLVNFPFELSYGFDVSNIFWKKNSINEPRYS